MRSRITIAAVISVLISLSVVQAVDAVPKLPPITTRDAIEGWCNEHGGSFFPPSSAGVYGCILPDGTIVVCDGTLPGCDVIPRLRHGKVGGFKDLTIRELLATTATEQQIITKLDSLANQVQSIVANQDLLVKQVDGLELACTTPDVVPIPLPGKTGPEGFCRLDSEGNLRILVYNQGGAAAGFFTTVVFFKSAGVVVGDHSFFATSLPAFGSVEMGAPPANFPITAAAGCFGSELECHFTIAVDFDNKVTESNEVNNSVDGVCKQGIL